MHAFSRRDFLATSLAAGTMPSICWAAPVGANDDLRIAIIGLGTRGKQLLPQFQKLPQVRVVALCDPDRKVLAEQTKKLAETVPQVKKYVDVRRLLDDDGIDAVVIAAPNHWHSLMGIWACEAGKDVYVEKPVSHNIYEGWQLLAAARRYDRIVQTGTQNRSDTGLRQAVPFIQSGSLGRIKVVRGLCYNRRQSIGKVSGELTPPVYVDYDLWSGPAPLKPLMRKQFHYDWHWDFTYGNGDVGNQGIHELDVCRWMLGQDSLPAHVISAGGRFGYDDDANTPNTLITVLDYEPAPIVFEVRGLPAKTGSDRMDSIRGTRVGIVVECEEGYFAGGRGGGAAYDNAGELIKKFPGDSGATHAANFVAAVRDRNRSRMRAEIHEGVLSTALSHMCNLSYSVGQKSGPDEIRERLRDEPLAAGAFSRMVDHLAANGVDMENSPITLGASLKWNNEGRRFVDNSDANALMSRDYRKPFVVPKLTS